MMLDRNLNKSGTGKYALINLRKDKIEWGNVREEDEFFVIKLKDRHSRPALLAYAASIRATDPEFADDVEGLAARAGEKSLWCKEPD